MRCRFPTRITRGFSRVSAPASKLVLPRCFASDHNYEPVEKLKGDGVGECSLDDFPETTAVPHSLVTVHELTYEIGVSRHVAFRLQQQYWCLAVEEVKEGCFRLSRTLLVLASLCRRARLYPPTTHYSSSEMSAFPDVSFCVPCKLVVYLLAIASVGALPSVSGHGSARSMEFEFKLPVDPDADAQFLKEGGLDPGMRFAEQRFWDEKDLHAASAAVSYEQMRPFLEKLKAGKGVTVVAFGDSITTFFGMCFHRDKEHMTHSVHIISPAFHACEDHPETMHLGWLSMFMNVLNKTFPHPDHLLVNIGVPAASLHGFAHMPCLEHMLPKSIDLVIFEHLPFIETHGNESRSLSSLSRRITSRIGSDVMPPAIILNMHKLFPVDLEMNSHPWDHHLLRCVQRREFCPTNCSHIFDSFPAEGAGKLPSELASHHFAGSFGWASFSFANLINHILGRLPSRTQSPAVSRCQAVSLLYIDNIHPGIMGRLLLADVLTKYLLDADEHLHGTPKPDIKLSLEEHEPDVLEATSHSFLAQCYGVELTNPTHTPLLSEEDRLPVTKSDGWGIVEVENGKFKPGWVATEPGATLWMTVDGTGFSHDLILELTFLKSYEHMGKARLSCVEGCECGSYDADFNVPTERWSGPVIPTRLQVTRLENSKCTLQPPSAQLSNCLLHIRVSQRKRELASIRCRFPTRVTRGFSRVSAPASKLVLPRCFASDHNYEPVEKLKGDGVGECSMDDFPETLARSPVTVQELTYEIGLSRQVAFRLQQQYWCRTVEEVKEGCFRLSRTLQINIEDAASLASKEPRLLASPDEVKQTFDVLRSAIGDATPMEAVRIAIYTPSLLTIPTSELQSKFQGLLDTLDVSREDLCSLVAQQPNILTTPAGRGLLDTLDVPWEDLCSLVAKQPNILTTPADRVAQRIKDVAKLLAPMTPAQAAKPPSGRDHGQADGENGSTAGAPASGI
eukprot:gene22329-29405_t